MPSKGVEHSWRQLISNFTYESSRACGVDDEAIATSREQILGELFKGTGAWSTRDLIIAAKYGASRRTVFRWRSRYCDVAAVYSLLAHQRSSASGAKRHDETRERLVVKTI
jgi:hypothetical protein